MTSSAAMNT